jgi:hypothetical protein
MGNTEEKRSPWDLCIDEADGVKTASKETGCEVTVWIYSASDMDKWQAFFEHGIKCM